MIPCIVTCKKCKEVIKIEMTPMQFMRYELQQETIHDIFPLMDPDTKELLVSGICGTCYNSWN